MADPAQIDIIADRRVPLDKTFTFVGTDFTASTFKMQVRGAGDTTGTPLIDDAGSNVTLTYAGSATVAVHVTAGRLPSAIYNAINPATGLKYVSTDTVTVSQIAAAIAEATIAALTFPDERGDDYVAFYDIIRTPSGGIAAVVARGEFVVRAAVTIP